MMRRILSFLVAAGVLHLCRSQDDITCNVTKDHRGTLYSVLKFEAHSCEHSWSNDTNHVLANEDDAGALVVNKNETSLLLRVCLEVVHYKRGCTSEGMERSVICRTNCSGNPEHQKAEESSPKSGATTGSSSVIKEVTQDTSFSFWYVSIPVGILLLVGVPVLVLVLVKGNRRTFSFTAVPMKNLNMNDVEAQRD